MANKHMKRCSTSLIYQRNANQNHNEVPSHTGQMASIKKSTNNKYWKACVKKREPPYTVDGNAI